MSAHIVHICVADDVFAARIDHDGTLLGLAWVDGATASDPVTPPAVRATAEALRAQLEAYFRGETVVFDVPLRPEGTAFQRRVWDALRRIPHGHTVSYAELATTLGSPGAARAVGQANGANPIPIVIPCHRVVARAGIGGFSAGLHRKEKLLALERSLLL